MSEFAMPAALELEASRRNGIPAFRREVVHNTTTQNEYRPGELCYIPMDTGAAGAFMDVTCTRLEFVVVVRNKNYFCDFINLPRCGWNAIIQEFGIELNNGLHELNRHYAECVELDMIKRGENRTPFEMCRSNPWKAAEGVAGKTHINFIKPSMVSHVGLPHGVKYPSLSTDTSATTPDTISQAYLFYSQPFTYESLGRTGDTDLPATKYMTHKDVSMVSSSMEISQSYWSDDIPQTSIFMKKFLTDCPSGNTEDVEADLEGNMDGPIDEVIVPTTFDTHMYDAYTRIYGAPQGLELRYLARTAPTIAIANVGSYQVAYGGSLPGGCSGIWPVRQPCPIQQIEKEYKDQIRFVNSENIVNYYANVKNIPVSIPVDLQADPTGSSAIWGAGTKTKPTIIGQYGHETEFHVSVKIYSSLIGLLADRWFPELVVPQGRMRVRLRFQEPNIVFQTLMDPCRRVPGTTRDFIPYLGITESKTCTGTADEEGTKPSSAMPVSDVGGKQSLKHLASGIHPIMVSEYEPGSVFVDAIAMGKFPLPQQRMRMLNYFAPYSAHNWDTSGSWSTNSSAGYNYVALDVPQKAFNTDLTRVSMNDFLSDMSAYIAGGTDPISPLKAALNIYPKLAKVLYEIHQNTEYGFPVNTDPRTDTQQLSSFRSTQLSSSKRVQNVSDTQYYSFPTDWQTSRLSNNPVDKIWIKPAKVEGQVISKNSEGQDNTAAANAYQYDMSNANADEKLRACVWNPFGVPIPQYVPMKEPWNKNNTRIITTADYVNENEVCYGTFLESSVAQVRRSHAALYPLAIPDVVTSGLNERLTYIVKNVQIVTQQIVLPRGTALSIVENALEGGITMECRAWKEMESMLPQAESQKHLINMAAAYCTDITFLFRPVEIYQGDVAYGYNSFSFYNPFTAFDFALEPGITMESQVNALGGVPVYYNECIMSTRVPFDIQLQISAELLPRVPIDSINALIRNVRWGDQVFSDRDYMDLNPHLLPSYQTSKGMAINTLQDGFWACYTPIHCLNDQTITVNPFYVGLEFSLRKKIRGSRAAGGSLPIFKPYDGTFHLSFNLEAYMGQSDRIRTGVPIVNNNMFLKIEKCHLARKTQVQLLTVAQCDGKIVFERGGTMQFFT